MEWNEAQTKTVEIELENEQAVQDMKMLIKLCYSGSYAKEDGEELLDRSTRIYIQSDPPTASEKDTKQNIVNVLAKALGPVNQFFGEGITRTFYYNCFYISLPLKPHVLALSPNVTRCRW